MASEGLNIILVDKNHSAFEATSNELRNKNGGRVEIKSIVMDLAKLSGEEIVKAIDEGTKGLDVGILINNAGMSYPYPKFFHEVDLELMDDIMKVNMEAASWMTKAVLPAWNRHSVLGSFVRRDEAYEDKEIFLVHPVTRNV
ncbi:hypothetical protein ACLB2K_034303 [Fragaria x ananassa]